MTDLVDSSRIEDIVGVPRPEDDHVLRVVTEDKRVYILHSQQCLSSYDDLRDCPFSEALDRYGLWGAHPEEEGEGYDWAEDEPIVVIIDDHDFLAPKSADPR